MKKYLCALVLLALLCPAANAELPELTLPPAAAETPALTLVTPMPTAEPIGQEFSCEAFSVYLPSDLEIMDSAALAGYEAAVQANHPGIAETQLVAADLSRGAAICFALAQSAQAPIDAAREAAASILGSADLASECGFGSNTGAGFACAISETAYRFYYFSNGSALLLVSACGLEPAEIATMLSTLDFPAPDAA